MAGIYLAESIGEKVKRLREQRGFTQGQLAQKARTSDSYVSRLEKGDYQHPSGEILRRIASALRVPVSDLVEERRPTERRSLREIIQELEVAARREEEATPILISEAEQLISGGLGAPSEAERWPYWPKPGERGHEFTVVRVVGTCMEPRIREGERVVVDKTASPRPGDIVAAVHDGENLVKKLEQRNSDLYLVAERDRPPLKIDEHTRILGVVKLVMRRP